MGRRPIAFITGIVVLSVLVPACVDRETWPSLLRAAAADDAGDVRRLITDGVSPDQFGPSGETPLIVAARRGALNAMRALLDAGADPDLRDARSTGWPPLMHAIHKNEVDAVRLLLERGADPNAQATAGGIPLVMAAAEPDPAVVLLLLAHGANPRADGHEGAEVLSVAVSGGALRDIDRPLLGGCHPATVRALLTHDPTLRLPDTYLPARPARLFARFHSCGEVLTLVGR